MYKLKTTKKFEKDFARCLKRNYDIELLGEVLKILEKSGQLPVKYRSHKLSGNFKGFFECHIKPDWLLIWRQNNHDKIIELVRTGTHADLY